MREIEADGYITREEDITPHRNTCFNCEHYVWDLLKHSYYCNAGRAVGEEDWRQKYSVCDMWVRK